MSEILYHNFEMAQLFNSEIFNDYLQIVIVTDNNIHKIYSKELEIIKTNLKKQNKTFLIIKIEPGEKSKTIKTKIKVENFMFQNNIKRFKSCLIALGGGVVGDLTGFVASTYKRGIDFIQLPTSLLSMVDSSIGGKNGINNEFGKNQIGTFYQPKYIIILYYFLKSLPREHIINGFAEILKIALIYDPKLWHILNQNNLDLIINNNNLFNQIIYTASQDKLNITNIDFYDDYVIKKKIISTPREHLNFGHTIGHILEFSCNMLHGYAVALGMLMELKLQDNDFIIKNLENCLKKYYLPTNLDQKLSNQEIEKYFNNDKKDGRVVLISQIGKSYTKNFNVHEIINLFQI